MDQGELNDASYPVDNPISEYLYYRILSDLDATGTWDDSSYMSRVRLTVCGEETIKLADGSKSKLVLNDLSNDKPKYLIKKEQYSKWFQVDAPQFFEECGIKQYEIINKDNSVSVTIDPATKDIVIDTSKDVA